MKKIFLFILAFATLLIGCGKRKAAQSDAEHKYLDSVKNIMSNTSIDNIFLGFRFSDSYDEITQRMDSLQASGVIQSWWPANSPNSIYCDIGLFKVDSIIGFQTDIMFQLSDGTVETEIAYCQLQIYNNAIYSLCVDPLFASSTHDSLAISKMYVDKYGEGYTVSNYIKKKEWHDKSYHSNPYNKNDSPFIRKNNQYDYHITQWAYKNSSVQLISYTQNYARAYYNKTQFEHLEKRAKERYCGRFGCNSDCPHILSIISYIEDEINPIRTERSTSRHTSVVYINAEAQKEIRDIRDKQEEAHQQRVQREQAIADSLEHAEAFQRLQNQKL